MLCLFCSWQEVAEFIIHSISLTLKHIDIYATSEMRLPFFLLSVTSLVSSTSAQAPIISRVSGGGTGPNETLLIQGTGLAGGSARLCQLRGTGWCVNVSAAPSSWDGGLKATFPADPKFSAAFSVAVCSSNGLSCSNNEQMQRFFVNAPRVSWVLGDGALDGGVVAGGVLRMFGSALAFDVSGGRCAPASISRDSFPPGAFPPGWVPGLGALTALPAPNPNTTVQLCTSTGMGAQGGSGSCESLELLFVSCFRVDAIIPRSSSPGPYTLIVDNGLASSDDVTGPLSLAIRVDPPATWSSANFTVGSTCGDIASCLSAASAAGGGLVFVPAGVWDVAADVALELGSGVRLIGDSAATSVVRWAVNTVVGAPSVGLYCYSNALLANISILFSSPIQVSPL